MTSTEIVIIIAGLFIGYRLVNLMLSPGTGEKGKRTGSSLDERESGSGDRKNANEQRERAYDSAWSSAPPVAPDTAPTWYQTLGITESASLDEIDRAYRTQISQYHPDKVAKLGEDIRRLAEARSKEINGAYDIAIQLRRK